MTYRSIQHVLSMFALLLTACSEVSAENNVLIIVGPSNHPPGTHEVVAGGQIMKHCLENIENVRGIQANISVGWPEDAKLLDSADSIVFIGDFFPPQKFQDPKEKLAKLEKLMQRGCGMVCIHYATGLHGDDVEKDGDHPLLRWIGGYFANRSCKHHESFARVFKEATIEISAPEHAINRGWKPFTIHDEPYYNNYFGKDGNRPASNVTVIATSMLPPESPKAEPVAWCIERPDSGRGFAVVMPHFYKSWKVNDLRTLILNGIVWSAKIEVPKEGVKAKLDDLSRFSPVALEPGQR